MVYFFFDAEPNSLSWRVGQELVLPIEGNLVVSTTEGLARAKTHKYAYLDDMVITSQFIQASQSECEFLEVCPQTPNCDRS